MIRSPFPVLLALVVAAAGCSQKAPEPKPSAAVGATPQAAAAQGASGEISIDPQSPLLDQIVREPVRIEMLPTDEVVAAGKIEANPNRLSRVMLPVTGRISRVLVKLGDAVRAGQPLFTVLSPDADAATSSYLSSRAAGTQAESALSKAQADFDRETDLFAHNAVAKKDVQAAESALAQAKAALEQSHAALEQATRRLRVLGLTPGEFQQEVVISSPLSGKVLELSVVPGEYRTDQTVPVMTVADLSTVWVTSQVPESYLRFVQVGERVDISLIAYPGETFEGRVSRIPDTLDPQTRTVKVQAEMDNREGRFRPEMYGSIHHVENLVPMAVIPVGAVVQTEGRSIVYVEGDTGHFTAREVMLGKPAGTMVRVTKGLSKGESVVSDGAMLMKGLAASGRKAGA